MLLVFIITDNHLTLNRIKSGSQSAKSHILRDMMTTFKKNTIIRIRRALLQVCLHTHKKEFVLMTGASSAEESTDIVQTYIGITQ